MNRLDTLGFNNPDLVGTLYEPNFELARKEGVRARRANNLLSANRRAKKHGGRQLILIDMQQDFSDVGRLPVPGTFKDVQRIVDRIYKGVVEEQYYSGVIVTLDEHRQHVIHGDSWWEDTDGNFPDVTAPVQMELVDPSSDFPFMGHFLTGVASKPFRPRVMRKHTVEDYAPHLKATGQGNIWVFAAHCRRGTTGAALIPAIAEVLEFASTAIDLQVDYMAKGHIDQTDWFGPFRPCMDVPGHAQGGLQTEYLDIIRRNQVIEIAGEAEDFCVRAGAGQVLDYYANEPDVLKCIRFIGDCTSPIIADDAGAGRTANGDFRKKMQAAGVQIIPSTERFA